MEDNQKKDEQDNATELEDSSPKDTEKKPEGSGIFTVDGKELPKVEGGYTLYHGGGTIGENNLK